MDRTFGPPRTSPVPPVILLMAAYGFGAGLVFVRSSIFCAGLTLETVAGLVLCLAGIAMIGMIAVFARHRLIWTIPLLVWLALNLMSITGIATAYVSIPVHVGHSGCGIA
ncbi:hypothetical protein [Asticcacaulis sp. AC402]|uniref:hypothetical protein n=1 Tax=Asticcacaulis sp. AC402 TaxID=1282361 RepID=UPI0004CE6394|nr:hypothetical protein [Asticcacaulis sp. AC402]